MYFHMLIPISIAFAYDDDNSLTTKANQINRNVDGALHIMTNNAEPIHTDVKAEVTVAPPAVTDSEKVMPPEDAVHYKPRSLRKSFDFPSRLDIIRSINRIITLTVLVFTAIVEFYPILKTLLSMAYRFMYL